MLKSKGMLEIADSFLILFLLFLFLLWEVEDRQGNLILVESLKTYHDHHIKSMQCRGKRLVGCDRPPCIGQSRSGHNSTITYKGFKITISTSVRMVNWASMIGIFWLQKEVSLWDLSEKIIIGIRKVRFFYFSATHITISMHVTLHSNISLSNSVWYHPLASPRNLLTMLCAIHTERIT